MNIPKLVFNRPSYSAFALNEYSFTHMKVINGSHIHFQQISDDQVRSDGTIADDYSIYNELPL